MLKFKLAPVLDVLSNAIDTLAPAKVDILIPCECVSQIEEELVPLVMTKAKFKFDLTGDVAFEDLYRGEVWGDLICQTSSFQDFVSHLNDRHHDEIIYAEHDCSGLVKPVSNPFIAITNHEKIAIAVYEAMRADPSGPIPRILKQAKESIKSLVSRQEVLKGVSNPLSDLVSEASDNTGLGFEEIVQSLKYIEKKDRE